ncbi:NADH-quinone oxidoreductase subunit L [bacterium]|nr:NADH-quinone oxidoreductase subunit L [bacterium]
MIFEGLRWILLAPLLGAVLNGVILQNKSAKISGLVATLASLVAFGFSVVACSQLSGLNSAPEQNFLIDPLFTWMSSGHVYVPFNLELTSITSVMLLVITGIGSLIHIYSISYLSEEESPWRFFSYLNLFLAAMLVLVLASNLAVVFLGWEGVGLCSYLLIGYWYKKPENTAAGMKAFITNRVGDIGFLIALFVAFSFFQTGDISRLAERVNDYAFLSSGVPTWAWYTFAGSLLWAATAKSAQIPLYIWLPDAMAGPTPVSALIHAATMVTSGIFLICRVWPLFAMSPVIVDAAFWIGMSTAWLAALIAVSQTDVKKVLAYSTVSQLGFMFVALGAGSPAAAFFHVITHACFKALLFLAAGSVIHGMHHKQEMSLMGGLKDKMKITHVCFLIGTLAIIGFPLTAGFFSKDMILAKVFAAQGVFGYILLLGAALLTAAYMFRAYTLCFWGGARSEYAQKAHESDPLMYMPLVVLAFLSLFIGWLELPEVFGHFTKITDWVHSSWYGVGVGEQAHLSHLAEWLLMLITSVLSLTVAYYSFKIYQRNPEFKILPEPLHKWSTNKFYVDEAFELLLIKPSMKAGRFINRISDETTFNGLANGSFRFTRLSGRLLALFHTGSVQTYAWHFVFWSSLIVGAIFLWTL